jgi:peptide/nickel transport system substrate-binding protein
MDARDHARMNRRRLTRRRFLGVTGTLAAAGAAYVAAGCGDGKRRPASASTPTSTANAIAPVVSRGGVLRAYNFDAMVQDTLDPHLTLMGPVANIHSAIFSKLYRYDDERAGTLAADLADGMPEQPDELTYIIKLRDGVRFHDAPHFHYLYPHVTGRNLEAGDVVYSIERQMSGNSPKANRFFRQHNWNVIESVEAPEHNRVVIKLKEPVAPFVEFLAGRHAYVIPHETVDRLTDEASTVLAMVGTGPFMLESFEPQQAVRLVRNPQWFARDDDPRGVGEDRPFLDAYHAFYSPQEDTFQRVWFERLAVDTTSFLDPAVLDHEHKTNLADIQLNETDAGGFLASRLLLDRAPFKDDRARRAVHLAIDRRALADIMFPPIEGRPSARLTGAIAPVMDRWAIPENDLLRQAGYRDDPALRDEDVQQARQLWQAALGDDQDTELTIFFSGVPKIIAERAAPLVQRQLSEVLGALVSTIIDESGYAVIASALGRNIDGATEGVVHFTFGFEDGGVDLDDWLYGQFHSGQPMNTYRLQDSRLDDMLEKTRAEFDYEARRELGIDIQNYLLGKVNARLEYCAPVSRSVSWGYVRNTHHPIWYGSDFNLANTWLDTSHPAWRRRTA